MSLIEAVQSWSILDRSFYARKTEIVAIELLGKFIVSECAGEVLTAGRIVETEAYLGANDPGAHASRGPTPRTELLWRNPGFAYVYLIYGMHHCLNFVTEREGVAGCVLIRAVEPMIGIPTMSERRGEHVPTDQLTNGPGKLTKALGIDLKHNRTDLTSLPLTVRTANVSQKFDITKTTRIGLTKGQDQLLRFYIRDNKFVSKA